MTKERYCHVQLLGQKSHLPFAICNNNGDIKGELNTRGGEGIDLKGELKEVSSLPIVANKEDDINYDAHM
ncbi:hypothetical protein ACSQ67_000402 [Phaseolus vulgaris]